MQTHREQFESRLAEVAQSLGRCLGRVIEALPEAPSGPQQLAETLGLDKGFSSRLLKAIRSRDPVVLAYTIPGPEPLRRLVKAAARRGVARELAQAADSEIDRFAALIDSAGDRSTLDGIVGSLLPDARRVDISVKGDDFLLPSGQATYVALILNELIQNAVEHGFKDTAQGRISVHTELAENQITVTVANDGRPLPEGFDPSKTGRLGLRIVNDLVRGGLNGTFTMESGDGIVARVSFPAP